MINLRMTLIALFALGKGFTAAVQAAPEGFDKGRDLYNSAGSCVACHMADGKGQPGSIPALAGSDWLDDPNRTIAIVLRGLAGPVTVNGKQFYSAMPPQLLFGDDQLALMITYVNNGWGNEGPAVTTEQVKEARATLPMAVYTPHAMLKAFPFPKNKQKANGTFKPDFDDVLTTVTVPIVYRTFMPGASPAAFAVALPGNQYYCWDAGECRLRYSWTKGGFIRGNRIHWSSNGQPVAEFNGFPYYRARSSLLKPEDYHDLAKTNLKTPFYDTTEALDCPIRISEEDELPSFRGYRLIGGYPEFRYQVGQCEIRELIKSSEDHSGIVRSFTVSPAVPITFRLTPDENASITASAGSIEEDGTLQLKAHEAAAFQITILEKHPAVPATTTTKGGNQ